MKSRFARLSIVDHMLLMTEKPHWPQHIGGLCVVDAHPLADARGSLDLEMVKRGLDRRLVRVPELRRVIWRTSPFCGRPVWVDDLDFSLDHHVHVKAVAPPGDEAALLATTELLLRPLLDRSHPLWELWLLTGLEGGRLGLLFKVHHAIADGLAAVALTSSFFDAEPGADDHTGTTWTPAPGPTTWQLLTDNLGGRLASLGPVAAHPVRTARTIAATIGTAARMMPEITAAPRTSLNQRLGEERRLGAVHLDVETARAVAHARGGKINDVVLDVVAGGLRELLLARGELTEGLELIAAVPVSLRRSGTARELGNALGVFSVRLPVWEADAARRLELIAEATKAAKATQSSIDQANQAGLVIIGWLEAAGLHVRERQRMINLMVSNVAGPTFPLYVLSARIEDVMPFMPPFGNATLTFVGLSYCGRLNLMFVADKNACPDLDVLVRGMNKAWQQLLTIRAAA
jgi:diacylglycerol O-acyltransferase / wax synthase